MQIGHTGLKHQMHMKVTFTASGIVGKFVL
jgi:hypothetical protein